MWFRESRVAVPAVGIDDEPQADDATNSRPAIEIEDLTKVYHMGEVEVHALRGLSLHCRPGN